MLIGEQKMRDSQDSRLQSIERFKIPDDHLRLTERFFSIEGEGVLIGAPCYLIRFAGCNLRCGWCDSKFASWWDHDAKTEHWQDVFRDVVKYPGWVSYTGGEPLWRHKNELTALAQLILTVEKMGRSQKMETSGTVDPPDWFPSSSFFWSIAPKTAGMGRGTFLDTDLLEHILTTHTAPHRSHIKFVIGARKQDSTIEQDFAAIKEVLAHVPSIAKMKYPVVFQPEGLTESSQEYLERSVMLVDAVLADHEIMAIPNWRVLPQWHQLLWRNERGK